MLGIPQRTEGTPLGAGGLPGDTGDTRRCWGSSRGHPWVLRDTQETQGTPVGAGGLPGDTGDTRGCWGSPRGHRGHPWVPPPVVDDAVHRHPLGFDAVAVEALLHAAVQGVLAVSPLVTLGVIVPGAVIQGRGLVHVVLALVVAVHDQVEDLQLGGGERGGGHGM